MQLPIGLISVPLTALCRMWSASLRMIDIGRANLEECQPAIGCLWHDELFTSLSFKRDLPHVALISPSRDGDYLAAAMRGFGFKIVRGSSSRGGAEALHELVASVSAGYGTGITVDGPRGPRHKVKPGALWLAARTGRPIVPIRVYAERAKTFASWDRFQLPLPFSTVRIVYGTPWHPEIDPASSASLRQACRELEQRLNALTVDTA